MLLRNSMSKEVFKSYRVNITKHATISSLAMSIYRSGFMPDGAELTMAKGALEHAIRQAYYGGAVDVYKPYGESLYYYDANSLYPAAMLKPLPVGLGNPPHPLIKQQVK